MRLPPLVLGSPDEAPAKYHEDWTLVPGAAHDAEAFMKELRLRAERNRLLKDHLLAGMSVWFKSSGDSMWPLVRSGDAILLHPIKAVTADAGQEGLVKEASEIGVGDIVFCELQRSQMFLTHIVLQVQGDRHADEWKYWIGNIKNHYNGYCFREHIYGILIEVQEDRANHYYARPFPKDVFQQVHALVQESRWSKDAGRLCEPQMAATA